MYRIRISLMLTIVLLSLSPLAFAQQLEVDSHVSISAKLNRVATHEAELVVTAQIAQGLHIYAQSQPKPFLATKLHVDPSTAIVSVGEFKPSRAPLVLKHEKLGVELHEHENTIQWTAKVRLAESVPTLEIRGSVFAQACKEELCYAPQTYTFTATLEGNAAQPALTASLDPLGDDSGTQHNDSSQADENATGVANEESGFLLSELQPTQQQDTQSTWVVLALAFVAGFLLNLMPCVLPVVGLKLLSLVEQANSDRRRLWLMNLSYTAGLLLVMMILASLAVFAGLGWGEQFSSVTFTVTLAAFVFAFGLSLLGVWEIPVPGFAGGTEGKMSQEGYGAAFGKGVLSTVLATPCSGPFLGAALAWAVSQPALLTYSVFASVGLGMASPYLVVGLLPSATRFLPRPGNWMVTFKQVMGFIMLATVVYLMSFMPPATVVPTVLLLLGLGAGLWYVGKTPLYEPALQQLRVWAVAGAFVALISLVSFGWLQEVMQGRFERAANRLLAQTNSAHEFNSVDFDEKSSATWEDYSPQRLEQLLAEGKSVFVDFTADWCLTCKANEAAAVHTPEFVAAMQENGIVGLLADKTEPNQEADKLLRQLGNSAASIPFYAVFSADNPTQPSLLDGIFTDPQPFVDAFERTSTPATPQVTSSESM